MLRIVQNRSSASAKSYYQVGDYYAEGKEGAGIWGGKGARLLGLEGKVDQKAFEALCDNLHPLTGEPLTKRTRADRTVGYDFNFHAPKSVSVVHALTGDERIAEAFREAVRETMQEVETEAKTRVRKRGENYDRTVGNLVWAEFIHLTTRPIHGVPDPLLHAHCFTFNTVYDSHPDEQGWKAGQFRDLKRDGAYFEAAFQSRLAIHLKKLGYGIERQGKSFELMGVSRSIIERFSRRTREIEALAEARGITNPEEKAKLGAKTRQSKSQSLSPPEVLQEWRSRLSSDEQEQFRRLTVGPERIEFKDHATPFALKHAKDHCFERASVVPAKRLLEKALRFGIGEVAVEDAKDELAASDVIFGEWDGQKLATTRDVLREEQEIIRFARDSRGTLPALNPTWKLHREWLNDGQKRAILQHLLKSTDRVQILKGRAGTGKTTLMQEAVEGIEAGGTKVFTFAPSAEASRGVLREKGFEAADTVARLLVDTKLQDQVVGSVLWIDEAGLIGTKTLKDVFELAKEKDCRVILSGDWAQHSSVERGSAMRLLAESAGLQVAEVSDIQRQKKRYKEIVESISRGKLGEGFAGLEALGWVKEYGDEERPAAVAKAYADALERNERTLVVSPTHFEGNLTTEAIRQELKKRGRIAGEEKTFQRLESRNWTEAERRDAHNYQTGDVIVFQQNAPGHLKGERIAVIERPSDELLRHAARFQVYQATEMEVAKGDLVRFTSNGLTLDQKHRLNNGATYQVAGFTKAGDVKLANGWVVSKAYGNWGYGFVSTSHSSQGKSLDHVILAQSSFSLGATNRQQWYVSVSRGEQRCTVITDDAASLREAIERSDERLTATELLQPSRAKKVLELVRRHEFSRPKVVATAALRQPTHLEPIYDR